jgi:hypothetical protein
MTTNPINPDAESLRQQVAALTEERDAFKKLYLSELAKNLTEVSPSEIAAAVPTCPSFAEVITRLRAGDPNAIDSWPTSTSPAGGGDESGR